MKNLSLFISLLILGILQGCAVYTPVAPGYYSNPAYTDYRPRYYGWNGRHHHHGWHGGGNGWRGYDGWGGHHHH